MTYFRTMARAIRAAALAAAATLAAALPIVASSDAVDIQETDQIPDRDWEARCLITQNVFYRLAQFRTGGEDRGFARAKVSDWVAQHGDNGSHLRYDYRKSVEAASDFVYGHPELNELTLAHFGYRSCRMQYLFPQDPLKVEAGQMLLLEAAAQCQKENPGDKHNGMLRDCLRDRGQRIAERVQKAKISVQE